MKKEIVIVLVGILMGGLAQGAPVNFKKNNMDSLITNYVGLLKESNPDKTSGEIEMKLRLRMAEKGLEEGLLKPIQTVISVQDYARLDIYKDVIR